MIFISGCQYQQEPKNLIQHGDYWEARLIEVEQAGKIQHYYFIIRFKKHPLIALAKLYARVGKLKCVTEKLKAITKKSST